MNGADTALLFILTAIMAIILAMTLVENHQMHIAAAVLLDTGR